MSATRTGTIPLANSLSAHSKKAHVFDGLYSVSLISLGQLCDDDTNHRRLFIEGRWIHNCNYEEPPKETSFLVLWWCKKMQSIRFPTSCIEAHINLAYKFYPCHHYCHRLRMKIINFRISPAYQYQLRGWDRFLNLQGWNYFSRHPHWLQDYSFPHHQFWIQIQIHGLKIYKIFEVTSYSQIQENTGGTPASLTQINTLPAQLQKKFPHPSSTETCRQPYLQLATWFPNLQ